MSLERRPNREWTSGATAGSWWLAGKVKAWLSSVRVADGSSEFMRPPSAACRLTASCRVHGNLPVYTYTLPCKAKGS